MSMKLEQQLENESTPDVKTLLTPLQLGPQSLPNRIAMSPMGRAKHRWCSYGY
jgi:2,4-dienoyl-CoA reductase-like NADH-dependent reductase (Old Yellow Enzyme family)